MKYKLYSLRKIGWYDILILLIFKNSSPKSVYKGTSNKVVDTERWGRFTYMI